LLRKAFLLHCSIFLKIFFKRSVMRFFKGAGAKSTPWIGSRLGPCDACFALQGWQNQTLRCAMGRPQSIDPSAFA
jgi:hypothetical protein